jgi:hypothetical protein
VGLLVVLDGQLARPVACRRQGGRGEMGGRQGGWNEGGRLSWLSRIEYSVRGWIDVSMYRTKFCACGTL